MLAHAKRGERMNTHIQKSIGGFNIDDVVRGELDKKAREKKELEEAERLRKIEEAKARRNNEQPSGEQTPPLTTQETGRFSIEEGRVGFRVNGLKYKDNQYNIEVVKNRMTMSGSIEDHIKYTVGENPKYVYASAPFYHSLFRLLWENREGEHSKVVETMRENISRIVQFPMLTLTEVLIDAGLPYRPGFTHVVHHYPKEEERNLVGMEGLSTSIRPDQYLEQLIFLKYVLGDSSPERVKDVYLWLMHEKNQALKFGSVRIRRDIKNIQRNTTSKKQVFIGVQEYEKAGKEFFIDSITEQKGRFNALGIYILEQTKITGGTV